VLILSFLFLGETLSLRQYIGCFIIIFGSFMITLEKFDLKIFKIRPAFWLMMLSSFLYAISVVLYKYGVEEIPFWHTLPYEGFGIALGALAIFAYKENKQVFFKETKRFKKNIYILISVNETIYVLARYTTYFALSLISASMVNVLSGFQPCFVLIFGIILSLWFPKVLREVINKKVLLQKIISIFLMFLGLYFIFS
jgi:drug/metabolite transporter (DMT)-like permease